MNDPAFPDIQFPSRRPWLVLAIIAIVALVFWWKSRDIEPTPSDPVVLEDLKPAAPPLPVSTPPPAAQPTTAKPGTPPVRVQPSTPAKPTQPIRDAKGGASPLYGRAKDLDLKGQLAEAREAYLGVLADPGSSSVRPEVERRLGEINIALVMSLIPMPEKTDYAVARGDSLQRIAKKFGTTEDLIRIQNSLKTNHVLRVGEQLKVLKGTFSIEVSKTRNDLLLKLNDRFFKRYGVATGKDGKTPIGTFIVSDKIKEPTWWKDNKAIPFGHPDNILGTRWMAIKATGNTADAKGYGIHGTWDDASIGKAASAGCVRMHNREVEELFILVPYRVAVTITE